MVAINFDVMTEEFYHRCEKHRDKQIDNSSQPAGAPMYYYCHGCGVFVDSRSKGWRGRAPARYCDSCKILSDHGMLDRLREDAECDDSE